MRCEHSGPHGQCPHRAVDGSQYCSRHCDEKARIKGYRLLDPVLRERFEHHSDEDSLKTVRQEIAILRSMVEDRLNMAQTRAEKEAAFQMVTPWIANINKLVENLTKLARQTSMMVGKAALMKLSGEIVQILVEELEGVENYDSIIDTVASRIATAVAETKNED